MMKGHLKTVFYFLTIASPLTLALHSIETEEFIPNEIQLEATPLAAPLAGNNPLPAPSLPEFITAKLPRRVSESKEGDLLDLAVLGSNGIRRELYLSPRVHKAGDLVRGKLKEGSIISGKRFPKGFKPNKFYRYFKGDSGEFRFVEVQATKEDITQLFKGVPVHLESLEAPQASIPPSVDVSRAPSLDSADPYPDFNKYSPVNQGRGRCQGGVCVGVDLTARFTREAVNHGGTEPFSLLLQKVLAFDSNPFANHSRPSFVRLDGQVFPFESERIQGALQLELQMLKQPSTVGKSGGRKNSKKVIDRLSQNPKRLTTLKDAVDYFDLFWKRGQFAPLGVFRSTTGAGHQIAIAAPPGYRGKAAFISQWQADYPSLEVRIGEPNQKFAGTIPGLIEFDPKGLKIEYELTNREGLTHKKMYNLLIPD